MSNRIFPASLDKLYDMLNYIKEEALTAGFDKDYASKIELASEEALVNIISYGYPSSSGEIEIQCFTNSLKSIEIVIKDNGVDYNPLAFPPHFDPNDPLKDQKVGGYGLFFIQKLMDEVIYRRENNANILTLIKRHT